VSVVNPLDFKIGDSLGAGASGNVSMAVYKPNGMTVAIKSMNIYDKSKRQQFKNDLKTLGDNNCTYLVRCYGAFFEKGSVKLVLEYMNIGSLDKLIKKTKDNPAPCIPEQILSKITHQMLYGLLYLHKYKHIIHRDLKPANVLINSDGLVKLTDFGITKTLENTDDLCNSFVGTKAYMSPERISGGNYSYASDLWSLGLIIYELATGMFPYSFSSNIIQSIDQLLKDPEPRLPDYIFSPEMMDFVARCLQKDPKDRASLKDLCSHPWILAHSENEELSMYLNGLFNQMIIDDC